MLQLLAQLWCGESCPANPPGPSAGRGAQVRGKCWAGICTVEMFCSRDLWESEVRAHVGTQTAAEPGQDGSNVPVLFQMPWGPRAEETSSLGIPQQTGQITPHAHRPQTAVGWRRPQKGGVPVLLVLGQGRLKPQESAHLSALIHGLCSHQSHCLGPGTLCLGEEDETHQMAWCPWC